MDHLFDQVIAELDARHAFREVLGGGAGVARIKAEMAPLVATPSRFGHPLKDLRAQGFEINRDDVAWLYSNQFFGLHGYLPLNHFVPWLRTYLDETLNKIPERELVDFMIFQAEDIVSSQARVVPKDQRQKTPGKFFLWKEVPANPIPVPQRRYTSHHEVVLKSVAERYPALIAAHAILQSAFPEWLYRLACRIEETKTLTSEQRLSAHHALTKLTTVSTSRDYLFGPVLWVAATYYLRTEGDLRQPLIVEDFNQGWGKALSPGGFNTIYKDKNGEDVNVRCPFKMHAQASGEVCLREGNSLADVSHGAWPLFRRLSSPHANKRMKIYRGIIERALTECSAEEAPSRVRLYDLRLAKRLEV